MKTALIIVACVLVLIAALLSLRVRMLLAYSEDGFFVQVRAAFLHFTIVPAPDKKTKKQKKKKKTGADTPKTESTLRTMSPLKGGSPSQLRALLKMGLESLGDVKKRVLIDYLRVHYTIAGQPNPATAALQYGGVYVAGGAVCILLEQYLNIVERDISAEVDFCSESSAVFAAASCSTRVGQILVIVLKLFKRYFTWKKQSDQAAQEENRDG